MCVNQRVKASRPIPGRFAETGRSNKIQLRTRSPKAIRRKHRHEIARNKPFSCVKLKFIATNSNSLLATMSLPSREQAPRKSTGAILDASSSPDAYITTTHPHRFADTVSWLNSYRKQTHRNHETETQRNHVALCRREQKRPHATCCFCLLRRLWNARH